MKPPQSLQRYSGGDLKRLLDAPDDALVSAGTLKGALAEVIRMIPNPGYGLAVRRGKDGDNWGLAGNAATPLFVSSAGLVTPGTIAGVMPTIGGVALDAGAPALSFSGSGVEYVVANITGTHSIVGGTFAANLTSRSVTITVSTLSPGSAGITSVGSGSPFRILLATFNNGVKTAQIPTKALTCSFYDDASGTAKLNCEVLF